MRRIHGALTQTRNRTEYENITSIRLPYHFLYYHEEGDLKISSGEGQDHDLIPGDVYFLFANSRYPSHKPTSDYYRSIKIFFSLDPNDTVGLTRTIDGPAEVTVPWIIRTAGDPEIFKLFQEILIRNNSSNDLSLKEGAIYLNQLLLKLAKITIRQPLMDQKISRVKEIIESNPMGAITIDDLAKEVLMSRSALMAQFKKFTGTTIMKYHTELKIKNACQLMLVESNIKLKELSNLFGFYDEFHFGRTFKSYLGMTVSQYKKEIAKDL